MPFVEGGAGELDGRGVGHVCIGKGDFDFACADELGGDGDASDAEPGEDDEACGGEEEPEGCRLVEAGRVGWVVGGNARVDPEDDEGEPSAEAVRVFEGVVEFRPEPWMRRYTYRYQADHEGVRGDDGSPKPWRHGR